MIEVFLAMLERMKFGGLILLSVALGVLPLVTTASESDPEPIYRLTINGPLAGVSESCNDPCHIEMVEVVGELGMSTIQEEVDAQSGEGEVTMPSECYGECEKKKTRLKVRSPRTLKKGVEVTIEDRWAHFIFYSVTETDSGPATRRRHHEFRVDRPLIAVNLDDHEVELRARVDVDDGVIRRKTKQP